MKKLIIAFAISSICTSAFAKTFVITGQDAVNMSTGYVMDAPAFLDVLEDVKPSGFKVDLGKVDCLIKPKMQHTEEYADESEDSGAHCVYHLRYLGVDASVDPNNTKESILKEDIETSGEESLMKIFKKAGLEFVGKTVTLKSLKCVGATKFVKDEDGYNGQRSVVNWARCTAVQ